MSTIEKVLAFLASFVLGTALNLWWWFIEYPHLIGAPGLHLR